MGQSDGLLPTFKILTHVAGLLLAKVLKQDFAHDVLLHLQVLHFIGQGLKQNTDYNIHGPCLTAFVCVVSQFWYFCWVKKAKWL